MFDSVDERLEYHANRATEELDRAAQSSDAEARRAHEKLSRLHLDKLNDLRASASPKPRGTLHIATPPSAT